MYLRKLYYAIHHEDDVISGLTISGILVLYISLKTLYFNERQVPFLMRYPAIQSKILMAFKM